MNIKNIKEIFNREGAVVITEFFTDKELNSIFPAIHNAHNKWLEINQEQYLKNKMINSNNLTCPEYYNSENCAEREKVFAFISSEKIAHLTQELIGMDAHFLGSQVFFNPKEHRKKGYWHKDGQYMERSVEEQKLSMKEEPVLHFHTPFNDDNLFELIPGSHLRWDTQIEFETRTNSNNRSNIDPLLNSKSYDCPRGGIRIFSAHAIHRGKEYGNNPKRFIFDPLFAKKTDKSVNYINPKAFPSKEILNKLENRYLFEI